MKRRRFKILL